MITVLLLPYIIILLFCLYLLFNIAELKKEVKSLKTRLDIDDRIDYSRFVSLRDEVTNIRIRLIQFITMDMLEAAIKSLVEEVQKERQTDNIL